MHTYDKKCVWYDVIFLTLSETTITPTRYYLEVDKPPPQFPDLTFDLFKCHVTSRSMSHMCNQLSTLAVGFLRARGPVQVDLFYTIAG